jgi:hypothetical protein
MFGIDPTLYAAVQGFGDPAPNPYATSGLPPTPGSGGGTDAYGYFDGQPVGNRYLFGLGPPQSSASNNLNPGSSNTGSGLPDDYPLGIIPPPPGWRPEPVPSFSERLSQLAEFAPRLSIPSLGIGVGRGGNDALMRTSVASQTGAFGAPSYFAPSTPQTAASSPVQLAQGLLPFLFEQPPFLLFDEPPVVIRPPLPEFPKDPRLPPSPDYIWKGGPGSQPGDPGGNWFNPNTQESLRPDINHPPPELPHYDYRTPGKGPWYRWYPDGRVILKS